MNLKCKIFGHEWKYYGFRNSQVDGNSIFTDKCMKCGQLKEEKVN